MSVWAFTAMGYDKRQAKKKGQRIPEKNLWFLAILGGGIGAYFGMQMFRHKTQTYIVSNWFFNVSDSLWYANSLFIRCNIAY